MAARYSAHGLVESCPKWAKASARLKWASSKFGFQPQRLAKFGGGLGFPALRIPGHAEIVMGVAGIGIELQACP